MMEKIDMKNKPQKNNDPFLPPFDQGIFINKISNTHNLIFNKFPLYLNHVLITTRTFEM